jgi:hypothetical protein
MVWPLDRSIGRSNHSGQTGLTKREDVRMVGAPRHCQRRRDAMGSLSSEGQTMMEGGDTSAWLCRN